MKRTIAIKLSVCFEETCAFLELQDYFCNACNRVAEIAMQESEIVKISGNAIGKSPLEIVKQSYHEAKKEMIAAGISLTIPNSWIEMCKAFFAEKFAKNYS